MTTYITIQGDQWDLIAYKLLGSANHTDKLMNANPGYLDYFIFPAGIELVIPEVSTTIKGSVPPWREVSG